MPLANKLTDSPQTIGLELDEIETVHWEWDNRLLKITIRNMNISFKPYIFLFISSLKVFEALNTFRIPLSP